MIFVLLFLEFFKTGLFSVGGGLATIPFLRAMGEAYGWFDENVLSTMVALGESTPGPIGVNMATYVGYTVGSRYGVLGALSGAVISTLGLVLPSVIMILLVSKVLTAFRSNKYVDSAFYGIRPAVTGMICAAGFSMLENALCPGLVLDALNIKALILFLVLLVLTNKVKLHPIIYIVASGIIGAVFSL